MIRVRGESMIDMRSAGMLTGVVLAMACSSSAHEPVQSESGRAAAAAAAAAEEIPHDRYSLFDLPLQWTAHDGRTVALQDVSGSATVIAMIYTNCRATCPLIIAALKRMEASLTPAEAGEVRFVIVSLDPERDTPGRLAQFARDTRLTAPQWVLLSGSDAAVRELAASIDVRYQRQADGEIAHTNSFVIIDRSGQPGLRQQGHGDVTQPVRNLRALLH